MAIQGSRAARRADSPEAAASVAELTSEHFVRGVALALRAQWEGDDHFQAASRLAASEMDMDADWAEFRADSAAAILAYLEILERNGFRIVRSLS
jgi:hypothetical protein